MEVITSQTLPKDAERLALCWHTFDALVAACEAAMRYDASIFGHATRGEVDLLASGAGVVEDAGLDKLYLDWMTKAAAALAAVKGGKHEHAYARQSDC